MFLCFFYLQINFFNIYDFNSKVVKTGWGEEGFGPYIPESLKIFLSENVVQIPKCKISI